ncbi:hypothetical protein PINS_up013457 [Pythium insidiosum]|nr:hypothetical protein PINS_up013457 [Pythium insidiosum]
MRGFSSVALLVGALLANAADISTAELPAELLRALNRSSDGRIDVLVSMREPRPRELLSLKAIRRRLRQQHKSCEAATPDTVQAMVEGLQQHARQSQRLVLEALDIANETTYDDVTSLWISNEVSIRGATKEVLESVHELPVVGRIRIEQGGWLPHTIVTKPSDSPAAVMNITDCGSASADGSEAADDVIEPPSTIGHLSASSSSPLNASTETPVSPRLTAVQNWALERVQAPAVWARGLQGEGVRVATMDSGILASHASLAGRMVERVGWFDAVDGSSEPIDPSGHGTSVLSILAGSNGLGVAPKASWLACRACDDTNFCGESFALECAQFLLCPFDDKRQLDCTKRPHVINMSWNYDAPEERALQPAIDAWIAAGIVPVFANGNAGPSCGSVASPADWAPGFSVGATTATDDIAKLSARGPSPTGEVKPDLSAPGFDVPAAGTKTADAVVNVRGTSAAAPLVSGAVALLLQAHPQLSLATLKTLLTQSSDRSVVQHSANEMCSAGNAAFPNNVYGHGRLNVLQAIDLASRS